MIYPLVSSENQSWRTLITPQILKNHKIQSSSLNLMMKRPILCFHSQNPETQIKNPPKGATLVTTPTQVLQRKKGEKKRRDFEEIKRDNNESQSLVGSREMLVLCGFGYWVQGFRCFPWLALNFHMTHSLNLSPSILQLVQNSGNLPMVAKPLYGILSDAFSINGARRIPYISIGDRLLELMQKKFPELGLLRQECTEMRWVESFLYHNFFRNGESLDVLLNRISNYNMSSFKAKSDFVKEPIADDAFKGILRRLYEEEVGGVMIDLFPFGGKMNKISESAIPFPYRAGNLYNIHYLVRWEEDGNTTVSNKHINWIRRLYDYMTPYVSKNPRAAYLNFRDLDIGVNNDKGDTTSAYNNIRRAGIWGTKYFKHNFNRLVRVKTIVDPTNFFTNEQSIPSLFAQY